MTPKITQILMLYQANAPALFDQVQFFLNSIWHT